MNGTSIPFLEYEKIFFYKLKVNRFLDNAYSLKSFVGNKVNC